MSVFRFPWLELSILTPFFGAVVVSLPADVRRYARLAEGFAFVTLLCALMACFGFYFGQNPTAPQDDRFLVLDELSAPVLPIVALLHLTTGLSTANTKLTRYSFAGSLATDSLRMAQFSVSPSHPWVFLSLLALAALPPYFDIRRRGGSTRIYAMHMLLYFGLMVAGVAGTDWDGDRGRQAPWATDLLLLAVLVRSGTVPTHVWITDLFEHASFGTALLFVAPLTGVYACVRLALPYAPDFDLHWIGVLSIVTALYAAGMASVQRDARRFFAFVFLSHSSLVLIGLELRTPVALCGALCLWASVALSLGGFGLTLRAVEARFGRLTLTEYHGLYEQSPALAVAFLLTGLASVGFPGTMGYVSAELLVDGAIRTNPGVGVAVVMAAALNGIAVVRAYFLLFTGTRRSASVAMNVGPRERFALLALCVVILVGGLFPQAGVASRQIAADKIIETRSAHADSLRQHAP